MSDAYWHAVRQRAAELGANGCSGVPDFHRDCCLEHDIHYRDQRTLGGVSLTRADADARFRYCLQSRSPLGAMSPMAWWRWAGVRLLGWLAWKARKDPHA